MSDRPIDATFPAHTLHPERVLYRIHRTVNDPVYFTADGTARFDLTDSPDSGTCYAAPSPIGAYVEMLGRLGTISRRTRRAQPLGVGTVPSAAVFGGPGNEKLFALSTYDIPAPLVEEGIREFGLLVLPPPG